MARLKLGLLVLISAGLTVPASARSPIYRCILNGQTVLTDKPCESATTVPTSGVAAPSPSGPVSGHVAGARTIVGDWRGQTQFQGAQDAQVIEEAHSVVPLVLTFSADGKVSGESVDNLALPGLWAPGLTPRLFTLDLTIKGCRYSGLNRRYAGNLIATFADNSAQFSLQAYALPIPGQPIRRYDVGATLRR